MSSDWLSSSAMPRSRPTGWSAYSAGRPTSYMAWPVSCSAPSKPENGSAGSKRVVTRTSPGTPSVNGCSLSSSRPRSNGNPMAFMTSTASARCLPALNLPTIGSTGCRSCRASTSRISPGKRRASALNIASISAGGQARAEFVHQRVVRREIARLAQQLRLVAHQVDDLLQIRREVFELAGLTRVQPFRFGFGGGFGQTRHQRHRRRDGEVALPAHLAQVGDLPVLESTRCWPGRDPAAA